uniref:ATP synthase F0 subunit 8 n=1 Tax=Melamphaus faber TaxID=702479 RepID=A0A4Y1JVY1_9HEMI|nr:ATP synthase F0 subunit 8 [Melamphaus faber]APO08874.1 ATP synthase F0 subunit 8 [Melamphaus faber]
MPQMAPLWWEILYLSISIMMMLTSIMIYHMKTMKLFKTTKFITMNKMKKYWMW